MNLFIFFKRLAATNESQEKLCTLRCLIASVLILFLVVQVNAERADEIVKKQSIKDVKSPFDATTCGPAAAYIVLRLYGEEASLDKICKESYVDAKCCSSVESVAKALSQRNVYSRGRRLTIDELKKLKYPSILLFHSPDKESGEHHFVVYVGSNENSITVLDPLGTKFIKRFYDDVALKLWTGVAIVTQPEPFNDLAIVRSRNWRFFILGNIIFAGSAITLAWFRYNNVDISTNKKRNKLLATLHR